jgi:hypothetical protein
MTRTREPREAHHPLRTGSPPNLPLTGEAPPWPARRGRSYHSAFQSLREATANQPTFDLTTAERFHIPPHVIHHHQRQGRLWSMGRGLFRFPDQGLPDDVEAVRIVAHHLGTDAVASHVTALFVHECTDIIPERWEFTVPREKRYITRHSIRIHTTKEPFPRADVTEVRGLRVTTLVRSILDAAKTIGDPSQIEIAIYEGITKGLLHSEELYARRNEAGHAWSPIESGLKKYARLESNT